MGMVLRNLGIGRQPVSSANVHSGAEKGGTLEHLLEVLRQRLRGTPRTPAELNYSLQLLSVMRKLGWHRSVRNRKPVDAGGMAIPWYTYAALEWLAPRVTATDVVFEYGAGNSTVWFGVRAKQVVSVEHDPRWLERVRSMVGGNVTLLLRSARGDEMGSGAASPYAAAVEEFTPGSFDIIVIDGEDRVACAKTAPPYLREDGLIILDNSDRPAYRTGIEHLHKQGFGRVDFYGFASQVGTLACTSVFLKSGARWMADSVPLVFQGW